MIWSNIYRELSMRITDMRSVLNYIGSLSPELAADLANVPDIKHIDLWREQTSNPDAEHPLPVPAVFIGFTTLGTNDIGRLIQDVALQVDLYVFWDAAPEADTSVVIQENAPEYLNLLTAMNVLFHGYTGQHFSTMRKVGIQRVDTGGKGNLYRASFECSVRDYSAQELATVTEDSARELAVTGEAFTASPESGDKEPLFRL